MTINVYRAWFVDGTISVGLKVHGVDDDAASNKASELAEKEGWAFLGDLDHLGTVNLEVEAAA